MVRQPEQAVNYRPKACASCGHDFTPASGRQQLCAACRALPEVRAQRDAEAARRYRERKSGSVEQVEAVTDSPTMSRTDRNELAKLVRSRAKLAKDDVTVRHASVLADAEAALARRFSEQDAAWAAVTADAREYMAEVQQKLVAKCDELGIPVEFRPSYGLHWMARGENADPRRRAELRAVVKTQAEAAAKAARLEVDRWSTELQTAIVAGGLSTDARDLLDRLPSAEELLPPLALPEVGDGS